VGVVFTLQASFVSLSLGLRDNPNSKMVLELIQNPLGHNTYYQVSATRPGHPGYAQDVQFWALDEMWHYSFIVRGTIK